MSGFLLLKEEFTDIEQITESDASTGKKKTYIAGKFMQSEVKNRNGRIYPRKILADQVGAFQEIISGRRSLGELSHPPTPNINPDRVSHMITELRMDGNDVYGKALILENLPMGKIVKALIDENIQLGVSSRGLGSLRESNGVKLVQPDFSLKTVDIVTDPSGPDCFPEALVEDTEWFFDGASWQRQERAVELIEEWKNNSRAEREDKFLSAWKRLLDI